MSEEYKAELNKEYWTGIADGMRRCGYRAGTRGPVLVMFEGEEMPLNLALARIEGESDV